VVPYYRFRPGLLYGLDPPDALVERREVKTHRDGRAEAAESGGDRGAQPGGGLGVDGDARRLGTERLRLAVELRHREWTESDQTHAIRGFMEQQGVAWVMIDEPRFKTSIRHVPLTSDTAYLRFHGRNYKNWFSRDADVRERYDHLYSPDELDPWVARAKQVAQDADDTYVVTNNHYLGKAVVNAAELASILTGEAVAVPSPLLEQYPQLREFTSNARQH